jgi:hypothetical protein
MPHAEINVPGLSPLAGFALTTEADHYPYSKTLLTKTEGKARPMLILNATDLIYGTAAAFSGGRKIPIPLPDLVDKEVSLDK